MNDNLVTELTGLLWRRDRHPSGAIRSAARGRLARLKRDAQRGAYADSLQLVMSCTANQKDEDAALTLVRLFALQPLPESSTSLASALRQSDAYKNAKESTVLRFRALLNTDAEDLEQAIRRLLPMLPDRGLNWNDLYWALRHWSESETEEQDSPQRQWARDFWAPRPTKNKNKNSNDSDKEKEQP